MDKFDEPLMLKYQGKDMLQTIPGGILTIIIMVCMGLYSFTKIKLIFSGEENRLLMTNIFRDLSIDSDRVYLKDHQEDGHGDHDTFKIAI
jgi:hypothetical protein